MTMGGASVYVCERDLNNGRVYITRSFITRSVITCFFPVDPEDRVIMELQCITLNKISPEINFKLSFPGKPWTFFVQRNKKNYLEFD